MADLVVSAGLEEAVRGGVGGLVEDSGTGWRDVLNVAGTGLWMRVAGWWPLVTGALIGVGATFWMTPFRVTSNASRAVGIEFTQEQVDRVPVSDAELLKIIAKQGLMVRERQWLPTWAVAFLFRQAITVKARDGFILFASELLPKDRRGMQFIGKPGEGDGEPARPYPVALPVFGALLGRAAGGLGRHLRKPASSA